MRGRPWRLATSLVPALVLALVLGCATGKPPVTTGPAEAEERTEDLSGLLSIAASTFDPYGPVESNRRSLEAARAALDLEPGHGPASFYAARAASWILEFDSALTEVEALAVAKQGRADAEAALAADSESVGNIFLAGALLGQELLLGNSLGLVKMRRVHDYFEQAANLDPAYDDGAPLRALGTLLVKAPPWPVGVGDEERGLELLEEGAERYPYHPASHLFLGDAQASTSARAESVRSYDRVVALCEEPHWGSMCARYAPRAREALSRLRESP